MFVLFFKRFEENISFIKWFFTKNSVTLFK
jgi:hypothetical protein